MPASTVLTELWERGFSRREIAVLAGVSESVVYSWQRGIMGPSVLVAERLGRMVGFCRLVERLGLVSEAAAWLVTPSLEGFPLCPLDLLGAERFDLAALLAAGADPGVVWDEVSPDRSRSRFEVFTAPDGLPSIRLVDVPV